MIVTSLLKVYQTLKSTGEDLGCLNNVENGLGTLQFALAIAGGDHALVTRAKPLVVVFNMPAMPTKAADFHQLFYRKAANIATDKALARATKNAVGRLVEYFLAASAANVVAHVSRCTWQHFLNLLERGNAADGGLVLKEAVSRDKLEVIVEPIFQ